MRTFQQTTSFALLASGLLALVGGARAQDLPKPDINGTYLLWKPDEQLVGYRNIEKIFPTTLIKRGTRVAPLPKAQREIDVRYESAGKTMTTDSFMSETRAAAVLVIHHGSIVLERYAFGYGPGQRWTSFSVGKSLSSTLAGAALKDGALTSLDDPVTKYLPGLKETGYEGVTMRQLLNMTSGVKWNEDYADPNADVARIRGEKSVNGSDPIVTYMARLPSEAKPGTRFRYNTGETHLAGAVVRAAIHKPLAEYLSEKIWAPYGMEKDAVWILDAAGHEFAGCCISATLRDFGRFGDFFMHGAKINKVSIVPDTWIVDATRSSEVAKRPDGSGYGYQWWVAPPPVYEARGIFGQLIHINPEKELVIVVQSANATATDRIAGTARAEYVRAIEGMIGR